MAAHTAAKCPSNQITTPMIQRRSPEANGGGERSVDDGNGARRASKQDRLDEGAMNRCVETGNGLVVVHHTSAPPPKEKKDKKNELAANAIARPKTIWISRRKPPDEFAEGEGQARDDDDDHGYDFGDRSLDRIQDLLQRLLPRHVGAGRVSGCRREHAERECRSDNKTVADTMDEHQDSPAWVRT